MLTPVSSQSQSSAACAAQVTAAAKTAAYSGRSGPRARQARPPSRASSAVASSRDADHAELAGRLDVERVRVDDLIRRGALALPLELVGPGTGAGERMRLERAQGNPPEREAAVVVDREQPRADVVGTHRRTAQERLPLRLAPTPPRRWRRAAASTPATRADAKPRTPPRRERTPGAAGRATRRRQQERAQDCRDGRGLQHRACRRRGLRDGRRAASGRTPAARARGTRRARRSRSARPAASSVQMSARGRPSTR